MSRARIDVLQGNGASVIGAEKRLFSAKTTQTTVSSKLWHSPTKLHEVITEDCNLKKITYDVGKKLTFRRLMSTIVDVPHR